MKKIFILLGLVCLSVVGFSQSKSLGGELVSDQMSDIITRLNALEGGETSVTPDSAALLVHYRFEEDTIDETGYRRDFTPSAAFIYNDYETEGGSWYGDFSSLTRYVDVPTIETTSEFVVMADISNGTTNESVRTIMGTAVLGVSGWELRYNPTVGQVSLLTADDVDVDSIYSDVGVFTVNTDYPYGVIRVAISTSGSGQIYINGVAINTSGSLIELPITNQPIRMGQTRSGDNYAYCRIDNVKIFSGTLTAAEITTEYSLNPYATPQDDNSPPIALSAIVNRGEPDIVYWRFDQSLTDPNDSIVDALSYTANDSIYTIDSVSYADAVLTVFTDSVPVSSRLRISYDNTYFSGLQNEDGVRVATYINYIVTNNLVSDSIDLAKIIWHMDSNNADSAQNYNAIDTAMVYSTDAVYGSHSGDFANATRKWWTPAAFNNDSMPENFSFAFWYRTSVSNTGMNLYSNERYGTTGEGIRIYANTSGDDLYMTAETGGSGAEIVATNSLTLGAWTFIVAEYTSSTGVGKLYVDGLDATTAGSPADADIDLSGPWRLGQSSFGLIDEPMIFDRVLTDAEVAWMFVNPGKSPKEPGTGGVPEEPPLPTGGTVFTSYADSVFAWDGEDSDLGPYTTIDVKAEWIDAKNVNANIADRTSIIDMPAVSGGSGPSTRCLRAINRTGDYSLDGPFAWYGGIPYDPRNTDFIISYNFATNPGFNPITSGKFPGWLAGYDREAYLGIKNGDRRNVTPPYHYEFAMSSTTFKNISGTSDYRLAPYLWWGGNPNDDPDTSPGVVGVSSPTWYDPDDPGSILMIDVSDTIWNNITWRINLGTVNGYDGFMEAFWNGKLCMKVTGLKLREINYVVDRFKMHYMFGGGINGASTGNEILFVDDVYGFRYRTDFAGYYEGESPAGRELLLPNGERQDDGSWIKY